GFEVCPRTGTMGEGGVNRISPDKLYPCKAKGCGNSFRKISIGHHTCSPKCAIAYVDQKKAEKAAKEARRRTREDKERIKSLGQLVKEAQAEFNKFIRLRDADLPCISCGRHHTGQYHAGHYRSTGAHPELRFEPDNVHKQCSACNNHLSGNLADYRINLIKKIGLERVEWLEGPHDALCLSKDDARDIKAHYRKKWRELDQNRKDAA
ncbi:MAG: recombination protein NinG, partial [Pseudomonadota bacterium]